MNILFPSTVVCRLILLSVYLASNRILKTTDPQKKPEHDSGAFKEDDHTCHSWGWGEVGTGGRALLVDTRLSQITTYVPAFSLGPSSSICIGLLTY